MAAAVVNRAAADFPAPRVGVEGSGQSGASGSGQGSGHRVNQALPTPNQEPLPTPSRATIRKRGGWIEFREKNGRRYARRRTWKKIDGQWRKTFEGRVTEIPVMTEKEYEYYVLQREQAKRIRAGR